ncbi:MAG: hypothetical protein R3B06_29790 [Kofleriaceae bacterium]
MRRFRWMFVLVALAASSACGGGGTAIDAGPDAVIDGADGCAGCDAPPACARWTTAPAPARALSVVDDPGPFTEGRTFRVAVEYDAGARELAAMPTVERAAATVTITPRTFRPLLDSPGASERRRLVVPLSLPAGTWQIRADGGAAPLDLSVGPAPLRPCGVSGACELDCDCAAGERCLAGVGLAGRFTACARPCEVDRDCGGRGVCASLEDGLTDTCTLGTPECGPGAPCPAGFVCADGACAPSFTLTQTSRHFCACDSDCDPGLRCVVGDSAGRCQAVCPTDGPWCQGAHVCGPAAADVSGLATTDSVCGFLGE